MAIRSQWNTAPREFKTMMARQTGSIFAITYYDGKFSMTLLDWGGEAQYERSRDGEVEQVLVFRRREYQETDAAYWYQKWTRPYCRDETPLW